MLSLSEKFLLSSFLRKQESSFFWIPGRVSLARNDDSTFPGLSNSGSPPAKPGVYLSAIMGVTANYKEIIVKDLEELPLELIQEVVDFIEFLKIKRMKKTGVDDYSLLLQQESLNRIWKAESEDLYEL